METSGNIVKEKVRVYLEFDAPQIFDFAEMNTGGFDYHDETNLSASR